MANVMRPSIYVLFGAAGSGKGTFGAAVKGEDYDQISTGDILRAEIAAGTEIGNTYRDVIVNHVAGGIPTEVINKLFGERIRKNLDAGKGIILDGYPATEEQFEYLDSLVEEKGLQRKVAYIYLKVDTETVKQRVQFRQICQKCNAIFNSKSSPPKTPDVCDGCNSPLAKRMDAGADLTARMQYFNEKMTTVFQHYQGRIIELNGEAAPGDCVNEFFRIYHDRMALSKPNKGHWMVLGVALAFVASLALAKSHSIK